MTRAMSTVYAHKDTLLVVMESCLALKFTSRWQQEVDWYDHMQHHQYRWGWALELVRVLLRIAFKSQWWRDSFSTLGLQKPLCMPHHLYWRVDIDSYTSHGNGDSLSDSPATMSWNSEKYSMIIILHETTGYVAALESRQRKAGPLSQWRWQIVRRFSWESNIQMYASPLLTYH